MKPSRFADVIARPCGAVLLTLMLASCGGGGGNDGGGGSPPIVTPPTPPVATQSLTLTGDASQVLAGGKTVTLTATPAVSATVTWTIEQGPGTLSASSGASVTYTPPAGGVSANTPVLIKASAGDVSKTYRVTVYPDPGAPGLSLITGTLGGRGDLDGKGTVARFGVIQDFAADPAGNLLVIDGYFGRLRKVSASGEVSTIDLPISSLQTLTSVSVAPDNTTYLLAGTTAGALVLKLMPDGSVAPFLTVAQTDQSIKKIVAGPSGVYLIGERHISTVGANGAPGISIGNGEDPTTPCRDGAAANARFRLIQDAAVDAAGNLIVQDCYSVRKVTPAGVVTTIAGDLADSGAPRDGVGAAAHFSGYGASVAVDKSGNIRELDLQAPVPTGKTSAEEINGIVAYSLRKVSPGGVVTTLSSGTSPWYDFPGYAPVGTATPPRLVRYLPNGKAIVGRGAALLTLADDGTLSAYAGDEGDIVDAVAGTVASARFIYPRSVAADLDGNLYVLDEAAPTRAIAYKITPAGQVTRIMDAGAMDEPGQIIAGPDGAIYVTQVPRQGGHWVYGGIAIYKLSAAGVPQLLAGSTNQLLDYSPRADGQGAAASFYAADLLGFDNDGNLYVADARQGTPVYRKITPQGLVSTIAALPAGVGVAPDGYRYLVDQNQGLIFRTEANGTRTVVAGTPGQNGNRVGALPGSLIPYPFYPGSPLGLAVAPIGPGSFAIVSGGAIIRMVLPH
jgi:hypothetical protein